MADFEFRGYGLESRTRRVVAYFIISLSQRGSSDLDLSARYRLYTSESDVCRRQIMTYKDDPRTKKKKIFIMAVDP